MSLSERLPSHTRSVDTTRITVSLWYAGLGFAAIAVTLVFLHRLGLPMRYAIGIIFTFLVLAIAILSWISRTMTSSVFFFAGKKSSPAALGLGGATDWMGGTFLILFFSVALSQQMILATALVLGLLLQAVLFSSTFQRAGVSTLPGYFASRARSQFPGYAALLVSTLVLAAIALAEYQTANAILSQLSGLNFQRAALVLIALAILPSIVGGWLALLLINAAFAIIVTISVLAPATGAGFLPNILQASLGLERSTTILEALNFQTSTSLFASLEDRSAATLLLILTVLTAGLSVLPHALSRLSLNARPIGAIESVGWSALTIFLILSALPLSIGLIGATPSSGQLAILLKSQPVLHMMPYFAILLAAFNGLAVTLYALSSAIVRALRRYRNLNPGEQSIFSTRLVVLLLGVAMLFIPMNDLPSAPELLLIGLAFGAGGLFVPLLASMWLAKIPQWMFTIAILCGGACVAFGLSPYNNTPFANPIIWGGAAMTSSAILIALGRLVSMLLPNRFFDSGLEQIRQLETHN